MEALKRNPMTSEEHFEFLVEKGIIDRQGRVICAKLFGANPGQDKPETGKENGN